MRQRKNKQMIVVIGDIMLDQYLRGPVKGISPEAPIPIVEHEKTVNALGGAGNVYVNLLGLGADAYLIGAIGEDAAGAIIKKKVGKRPALLVENKENWTTLKTRIVSGGQHLVRIDREKTCALSAFAYTKMIECIYALNPEAIIVSDYGKGVVTADLCNKLRELNCLLIADPKDNLMLFDRFDTITPNESESRSGKMPDVDHILITLGSKGMKLISQQGREKVISSFAKQVFDVTGAGDTVVATYTYFRTKKIPPHEAAVLANVAAGIVVGRVGTSPIRKSDLLSFTQPFNNIREVPKEWGKEIIFADNHLYCGKLLVLKKGYKCSSHFHRKKDETFYLLSGMIMLDLNGATNLMKVGESVRVKPYDLHSFEGINDSIILEISSQDLATDSYRLNKSGPVS